MTGAKWGDATRLYGDVTRLYGADSPTQPNGLMQWVIEIDWTGNGFSGENEADRCIGYHLKRGREYYVRAGAKDLEPMQYYASTIALSNHDYRYDPYNTASPLYPNVRPGRKIFIAVKDLVTGIFYNRVIGIVADIQPVSGQDPRVTITFYDGMKSLYDTALNMAIKTNTTVSQAIYDITTAAQYPFGAVIEPWAQPIPVFDGSDINAYDALSQLSSASLGTFFIDNRGHARYYPLNYAGMQTWTIDQADCLKEIATPQPWDVVRNMITVTAQRKGKTPVGIIFSMGSPVLIPHGGYASFDVSWERAVDVGSNYQFSASYNPSGVPGDADDISGWVQVTLSNITATGCHVNAYKGEPVNPGWDGYLTRLDIYGCKLITSPYVCKARDDVSAAPGNYGPRRLEITNPFLQDSGYARAISLLLLEHLKNPQKLPTIQIDTRPDLQFSPDVMDKVAFTAPKLGIDDTFQVAGIEEEWKEPNGQSVLTTLYLHQVPYSTATITPDPYYPPAIPPVNPPGYGCTMGTSYGIIPGCGTGSTHGTPGCNVGASYGPPPATGCLSVMPANGPDYVCGSRDLWSNDPNANQTHLMFPCYIRPGSATNKTTLSIAGTLYADTGGGMVAAMNDGWEAYASDMYGNIVAQGVKDAYTGSAGYGVRTCHFAPPANTEIAGFVILVKGALAYTPVAGEIWKPSGWYPDGYPLYPTTAGDSPYLDVVAGNYYSLYSADDTGWFGIDEPFGPGQPEAAYNWEWQLAMNSTPGTGRMGWSGCRGAMYSTMPQGIPPTDAVMQYLEIMPDGKNTRLYFMAGSTGILYIRPALYQYSYRDGGLTIHATGATASGAASHFAIDSVSVYNTCPN